MSMSNAAENSLLLLIFNNTNFANVGDATGLRGSSSAGSLYIALHTADPGEAGDQQTSEATYTGYARQAVVRSAAGFTVSGTAPTQVANAAVVEYPANTLTTNVITYFSIGLATSGASVILASGALGASVTTTPASNPVLRFPIGTLTTTVD